MYSSCQNISNRHCFLVGGGCQMVSPPFRKILYETLICMNRYLLMHTDKGGGTKVATFSCFCPISCSCDTIVAEDISQDLVTYSINSCNCCLLLILSSSLMQSKHPQLPRTSISFSSKGVTCPGLSKDVQLFLNYWQKHIM